MEKLKIIKTNSELAELQRYIEDKDFIAFDTETTGVEKDAQIIGFSVCDDVNIGFYVVLSYWDVVSQSLVNLETCKGAREFIKILVGKSLIMQNAPFDCAMVKNNYGIDLMPHVHTDTLILGHLLDENRSNGLKELATALYGEDSRKEQDEMKASVQANGGELTKKNYEIYKADVDLIAKYGAKDAILTLKIFYDLVPELYEQKLDKFFYEEESMPLLRGPTYDMNNIGLRVDPTKLSDLKRELETECLEAKAFIYKEINFHIKDRYPGTSKVKTFNINAPKQIAWLVFIKLENVFHSLTKSGRELCKILNLKVPYTHADKRSFIECVSSLKGNVCSGKKITDVWHYMSCGKESLEKLAKKYKWAEKFLEYKKNTKLLNTYVEGIQSKVRYNIINPSFLQHGTTSGRYSCRHPNFQNLPRDDKRIKSCIISRPGKVFVGADYSQLEPRVFASVSKDKRLLECFSKGEDFYSVVGVPIFHKEHLSTFKEDKNSFAKKHPELRNIAKAFALATPYGTSSFQQSMKLGLPKEECEQIIDNYFTAYPQVEQMMLDSHDQAKSNGVVYSLFGRPRRIPEALEIDKKKKHGELLYAQRTLLNLGMNHRVQSTAASIMNRAAIAVHKEIQRAAISDHRWKEVHIVLQVHDELILEGPETLSEDMVRILKDCMENTVQLPGVKLVAEPKISNNLADLK